MKLITFDQLINSLETTKEYVDDEINNHSHPRPQLGNYFVDGYVGMKTDGVMEIGKYIDFHNTDTSTNDYDLRLQVTAANKNTVSLPTASGTLALTSDNVASATKLQNARTINDVSFNGTADITISLKSFTSTIGNDNTNNYHRILSSETVTGTYQDRTIILMGSGNYSGGPFGIFKVILRTNNTDTNSSCTIEWIVRKGFSLDSIVYNIINTPGSTIADIFYKGIGTYASINWTVLFENSSRGGSYNNSAWTKYTTNASGTEVYTETTMKAIRSYTSTLVEGSDVTTVKSANTLATARTINGTSFNGSANITTANWGTARTIYIADNAGSNTGTGVSVNGSGNATLKLPATIAASLTGNASTATTLQTARTINGTSFNGSANITTANWGTARTLTIGNTGKSVNGSGNVSWTLSEIGAAASSHSHTGYATEAYVDEAIKDIDTDNLVVTNSISMGRKANTTIGTKSIAVGNNVTASGYASHAEGEDTTASGYASHAEGHFTTASGDYSHAEGYYTEATIGHTHAEGFGTRASSGYQHVQGKYNIADLSDKYAHIVGNGTDASSRSNAHTLDWYGNAWFAGNITIGADNKELATKEYVTNYVPKSSESNYTDTYVWIDSNGTTVLGDMLEFHNGTVDTDYGQCAAIYAENSTDLQSHAMYVWGHWNSGDIMGTWDLGGKTYSWGTVYAYYGMDTSSDRNLKENINYIRNNEILLMSSIEDEIEEQNSNSFTYSDLYDFVKTDLELATYNYKGKEKNSLGFIAQDLLYNADGTDNKIGQFIVPPVVALTESELEEKKAEFEAARKREATAEELEELATPKLEYNQSNYISVLAGALKETIKQVEELKDIVAQQQESINQLLDNK